MRQLSRKAESISLASGLSLESSNSPICCAQRYKISKPIRIDQESETILSSVSAVCCTWTAQHSMKPYVSMKVVQIVSLVQYIFQVWLCCFWYTVYEVWTSQNHRNFIQIASGWLSPMYHHDEGKIAENYTGKKAPCITEELCNKLTLVLHLAINCGFPGWMCMTFVFFLI